MKGSQKLYHYNLCRGEYRDAATRFASVDIQATAVPGCKGYRPCRFDISENRFAPRALPNYIAQTSSHGNVTWRTELANQIPMEFIRKARANKAKAYREQTPKTQQVAVSRNSHLSEASDSFDTHVRRSLHDI